ncbi:MAG: PadR family transcriptional regulator, partial [Thermoleophilaceae bacterium]
MPTAASAERPAPALPTNFMSPCILLLLGEQRAHGYDLLARLPQLGFAASQRDGRYADSGFVYRTLHKLEKDGLVCSAQE